MADGDPTPPSSPHEKVEHLLSIIPLPKKHKTDPRTHQIPFSMVSNQKLSGEFQFKTPSEGISSPSRMESSTIIGSIEINLETSTSDFETKNLSTLPNQLACVSSHFESEPLYQGKPMVTFNQMEKSKLINGLNHVLIAKFSHRRPALPIIKSFFQSLNVKGVLNVSLFDSKHVVVECEHFDDFVLIWIKKLWTINGSTARIFKWDADFHPSVESSITPIWIHLPCLPLFFYDEWALLKIAKSIGRPLFVDKNNLTRRKLAYASICVEIDVSKPLIDQLWIRFVGKESKDIVEGYWQKVVYDFVPPYCSFCHHLGHRVVVCKRRVEQHEGKESSLFQNLEFRQDENRAKIKGKKVEADMVSDQVVDRLEAFERIERDPGEASFPDHIADGDGLGTFRSRNTAQQRAALERNLQDKTLHSYGAAKGIRNGPVESDEKEAGEFIEVDNVTLKQSNMVSCSGVKYTPAVQDLGTTKFKHIAGLLEIDESCVLGTNCSSMSTHQKPSLAGKQQIDGMLVNSFVQAAGFESASAGVEVADYSEEEEAKLDVHCTNDIAITHDTSNIRGKQEEINDVDTLDSKQDRGVLFAVQPSYEEQEIQNKQDIGCCSPGGEEEETDCGQEHVEAEELVCTSTKEEVKDLVQQECNFQNQVEVKDSVVQPTYSTVAELVGMPSDSNEEGGQFGSKLTPVLEQNLLTTSASEEGRVGTDERVDGEPVTACVAEVMQEKTESWADQAEKAEEEGIIPVVSQDTQDLTKLKERMYRLTGKESYLAKEEQIRIVSQLSPSEVEDFAKKDIGKIWATPTKVTRVFDTSRPILSNPYIRDKEGSPVICSEIFGKSKRLSELRIEVARLKTEENLASMEESGTYDELMKYLMEVYSEGICETIENHQSNIW